MPGTRTGDIVRFLAPDYRRQEVFAHVGGRPLGMAFAKDGALLCCIGGMGLYRIGMDRQVTKLTDETNRSPFSIIDDSRLKLADDLDIAPDGRVFFSEATIRYEMHEWAGGLPGIAGQRPDHLLRPEHRTPRAPCCGT